jgi:hypothetical protein
MLTHSPHLATFSLPVAKTGQTRLIWDLGSSDNRAAVRPTPNQLGFLPILFQQRPSHATTTAYLSKPNTAPSKMAAGAGTLNHLPPA